MPQTITSLLDLKLDDLVEATDDLTPPTVRRGRVSKVCRFYAEMEVATATRAGRYSAAHMHATYTLPPVTFGAGRVKRLPK